MPDQNNTTGTTPQPPSDDKAPKNDMAEIKKKIEAAKRKEEEETKKQEGESAKKFVEQVTTLKLALETANTKALRALADLQNAKKRMDEEKSMFAAFATKNVILNLLDLFENFERVMSSKPAEVKEDDWLKGLELVFSQFQKFFESHGVRKIEVKKGDKIDPKKHEAMMTSEGEEGVIIEILASGYEMNGKVIRAAKVKVGKK